MKIEFIGRKEELAKLDTALHSPEAEMVAVIGRRRVGKTLLITTAYEEHIVFELTGVQNGSLESQLQTFADQLNLFVQPTFPIKTPDNWLEAFKLLRIYLQTILICLQILLFTSL